MTQEKKIFLPIQSNDICEAYEQLLRAELVSFSLTKEARNKVDSTVANINGTYFGHEMYDTAEEKAVAYFYFLIKNHPFVDGNKRTATLTFLVVCQLNKLALKEIDFELDQLAVFIESIQEKNHQEVIKRIAGLLFG